MNKLFNNFNKVTLNTWNEKVISDLKGANYKEKLVSDFEGIEILPIYNKESVKSFYSAKLPNNWTPFQLIEANNAKQANKEALEALTNNIDGICFSNPNNLDVLLENISVEHISINFTNTTKSFPQEWDEFCRRNNTNSNVIFDENIVKAEGKTAKEQIETALTEGLKKKEEVIQFNFEIGSNFFLEIAKIKAFRILWKDRTGKEANIFCETSTKNKETDLNTTTY